jgi:fucose 4-O-acetylase-like acetyltransferase
MGAALGLYLVRLSTPVFYNMREGVYGIPGLSFVLAICCIACLILISKMIPAQRLLTRLGAASMGIMVIHKQLPVIAPLERWAMGHGYAASVLFTAISLLVTELLRRTAFTRALLLGSEADFRNLEFAGSRVVRSHATSGV